MNRIEIMGLHCALYLGVWLACDWYDIADKSAQLMGMIWK